MRQALTQLLFLLLFIPSKAQVVNDSLLIGSWCRAVYVDINHVRQVAIDTSTILSFYADKQVQRIAPISTSVQENGQWVTRTQPRHVFHTCNWTVTGPNHDRVRMTTCRLFPSYQGQSTYDDIDFMVLRLTKDSLITKLDHDGENISEIHYIRVPSVSMVPHPYYAPPPVKTFYFSSISKPGKTKLLMDNPSADLSINKPDTSSASDYYLSVTGQIDSVSADSIWLRLYSENLHFTRDENSFEYNMMYNNDDKMPLRKYSWSQVESFDYVTPFKSSMQSVGGMLMGFGIAGALIGAPIAAYKFKDHNFSIDVYKKWVVYSLIGFGVGIPIEVIGQANGWSLRGMRGVLDPKWTLGMKNQ